MTERVKDGGPAFPHDNLELGDRHLIAQPGMSLRDWFAGQAIAGMLSNSNGLMVKDKRVQDEKSYAFAAYAVADAMLKARNG